jgi:hypothetical protein
MTGRLDWRRAIKYREVESKYGRGVTLRNGQVTPSPTDELSRRAERAMRVWLRKLPARDRAPCHWVNPTELAAAAQRRDTFGFIIG